MNHNDYRLYSEIHFLFFVIVIEQHVLFFANHYQSEDFLVLELNETVKCFSDLKNQNNHYKNGLPSRTLRAFFIFCLTVTGMRILKSLPSAPSAIFSQM